jgi:cell shape-determining protein MreC
MRRNWLQRYKTSVALFGALLFIACAAIVVHVFSPGAFARVSEVLFSFGESVRNRVSVSLSPFIEGSKLAEENAEQKRRIEMLEAHVSTLEGKGAQYDALLAGFGFSALEDGGILGEVVGWPPFLPYDVLLVRGGEQGSEEGMLALSSGMVPVGVVQKTYGLYAEVRLFSSPSTKTEVWVGESRIPATLEGQGGGSARILLPSTEDVVLGDPVFYPLRGGTAMGVVGKIERDAVSGAMTLFLETPVHTYSSSWVLLIPGMPSS